MIVSGIGLIFFILLAGCRKKGNNSETINSAGNGSKSIVGKWEQVDGEQVIEFFPEGTVLVTEQGDPPIAGDYRFIDKHRIRMDLKGLGELLGPVIAEISLAKDVITLTNPSGEIEKYRKLPQIGKATKSNIAGDYRLIIKTPDGEELKSPGLIILKENGTGLVKDSGKWEIKGDNQLEFPTRQGELSRPGAEVKSDTLYIEFFKISLRKQRDAKVIKKLKGKNILWSKYYFKGSGQWDKGKITLKIKEDGTFRQVYLQKDFWKGKDGLVEIISMDENQKEKKLKGRVDGNTIVFQDGDVEIRYLRVEN